MSAPPVHIPRPLARRIDRLSRKAHRFHRLAHHPLCPAYASEVLRLPSGTLVCRGCTLVAAGGASGLGLGLILAPPLGLAAFAALAGALALAFGAAAGKIGRRLLPALGLAFALGGSAREGSLAALALAAAVVALAAIARAAYRARGPDRTACAACAEAASPRPCPGFAEIVERERAFQREAGAILEEAYL